MKFLLGKSSVEMGIKVKIIELGVQTVNYFQLLKRNSNVLLEVSQFNLGQSLITRSCTSEGAIEFEITYIKFEALKKY